MKVVRQNGSMDCGVCCLLSVIRHYGGNLPIEYLREMTATDRNGVSAGCGFYGGVWQASA